MDRRASKRDSLAESGDGPQGLQNTYEGTALRSRSLPRSAEIQTVLKTINDDFLHANPRYYDRHTRMDVLDADTVSMKLEYFDEEQDYIPHTFSLLHLICVLQDSLSKMFADQIVDQPPVPVGLSNLETTLRPRVNQFLHKHSDRRPLIEELGIWRSIRSPDEIVTSGLRRRPGKIEFNSPRNQSQASPI